MQLKPAKEKAGARGGFRRCSQSGETRAEANDWADCRRTGANTSSVGNAMDKTTVLARLAQDKPLFHHLDEDGVRRLTAAGITAARGDCSWAVQRGVLQWIADHLSQGDGND